jgi:uridine kinase
MSEIPTTLRPSALQSATDVSAPTLVPRPKQVVLRMGDINFTAEPGKALVDILPRELNGSPVVAALLGRRPVSLTTQVAWDAEVEPIVLGSFEGTRIYRLSQALLLLEAAQRVAPDSDLRLAHSVGFGRRVLVGLGYKQRAEELAQQLQQTMLQLVLEDRPLVEIGVGANEAKEYFRRVGWSDTVELLATWRDAVVPLATYGRVYALILMPLLPSTGMASGSRILADRGGLLLLYGNGEKAPARTSPSTDNAAPVVCAEQLGPAARVRTMEDAELFRYGAQPAGSVSNEEALAVSRQTISMTQQQDRWLETLDTRSVGAFNRASITGHVGELINVSEGFHEKRISRIADEVHGRGKAARIVCIAGPSSSGKTTFIKRLRVQLQVLGMNPTAISLDNYYCDREQTPKDVQGEYDFEALEALRLDLFQEQLGRLLKGESVATAHYDFKRGKSEPEGGPELKLDHHSVLMLEGIHGLNPALLSQIGKEEAFRVFICPLAQLPFDRATRLHASDVRLIRRIVRDRHSRGYNAADTIVRWDSVRAGERKHIFPFQQHADAVFDSSLIYEIAVLKVYAERYLLEVPRSDRAWLTAFRLLGLVDRFVALYPDRVPPTSILREFIGGSSFQY